MPLRAASRLARRRLHWLRHAAAAGTLTLGMLHGAPDVHAQVQQGSEFGVNVFTQGFQGESEVGVDQIGNFVVVWETAFQDGDGDAIYARCYAADGTPRSDEFQVNVFTTSFQENPAVAMSDDGHFVVAWQSDLQDGDFYGVYARRYSPDCLPAGNEFLVNVTTIDGQGAPQVAMDDAANFVVVWEGRTEGGTDGVYGRLFEADGTPQGGEFLIGTSPVQRAPDVAMDADGDFIVAWESQNSAASYDILGQRYAADGTPQEASFLINDDTIGPNRSPSVAMDANGNVAVAWEDRSGASAGVLFRLYENDAVDPITLPLPADEGAPRTLVSPEVAMDRDGDFAITWEGEYLDPSRFGTQVRTFSADGTPNGPSVSVNTFTESDQRFPNIAMDADGDFVVTWRSYGQDGDNYGVYAQRFAADPVAAEDDAALPAALVLDAVFPNPVRDAATVRYALSTPAAVRLTVTDVLGRTMLTRAEGMQPAGEHEERLALDALPSGVYVVRIGAGGSTATQRVTVVR